jgi:dTDP-4-dehydrorhamnose 3,5-epimerase
MKVIRTDVLPPVCLVEPRRLRDGRGFFSEVWRADALNQAGISVSFVQDNHSASRSRGVIRGLHFQTGESAQAKLVRCTRGSILDVAVDIRHGSPTFGRHFAVVLSADNWLQLYVPVGFAHGFCTLEPDSEVIYKTSAYYDPAADRGVAWDDPTIGIDWPIAAADAVLSEKDRRQPRLADLPQFFPFSRYPD